MDDTLRSHSTVRLCQPVVRSGLSRLPSVASQGTGTPADAQTVTATTGAINGVVTDSTKTVVPGVTVSLSGPSLMTTRTALTDEAGAYRFSAVPPGDHTLTFQLAGFGTIVREGIHVGLGFTATVNVELSPATVDDQRHRQRRGAGG